MASTNKTPNLNLPQWQQSDKPEMADFNNAFENIEDFKDEFDSHLAEDVQQGNPHGIDEKADKVEIETKMYTVTSGFASGWSGEIMYGKTNKDILIVNIYNLQKTGDIGIREVIFTLPTGFRPINQIKTTVVGVNEGLTDVNGSIIQVQILSSGAIRMSNLGNVTSGVRIAQGVHLIGVM